MLYYAINLLLDILIRLALNNKVLLAGFCFCLVGSKPPAETFQKAVPSDE
jgi:hypothetical protein